MLAPLSHVMECALIQLDAITKLAERPVDDWRFKIGLPALDDVLLRSSAGLRRGQVVEVRGPHGSGRSALLGHLARSGTLRQGAGALLVTPRSRSDDVLLRLLLAEARVGWREVSNRALRSEELERIQSSSAALWNAPLWINDEPATLLQLEHDCRAMEAKSEALRVLLVDDLSSHWAPDWRNLHRLAVDLGLVVVAVPDVDHPMDACRADVTLDLCPSSPMLNPVESLDIHIRQVEGPDATVQVGFERGTGAFVGWA